MTAYRLTPAAQRDLSEIWDFTRDRWGDDQAEKYIAEDVVRILHQRMDPTRHL